ncbi:hypothetical protein PM082_008919 [Marasmius tenuissimus]|nr:hypothetical protein PM082_008919 [Marasmius tenuissimus]
MTPPALPARSQPLSSASSGHPPSVDDTAPAATHTFSSPHGPVGSPFNSGQSHLWSSDNPEKFMNL